jgi:hypothetical protein
MELPTITNSQYGSLTTAINPMLVGNAIVGDDTVGGNIVRPTAGSAVRGITSNFLVMENTPKMAAPAVRRLVRVIIADPHPDIPLNKALLHNGEEQFTDATDSELFFEVPIQELLKQHNDKVRSMAKNSAVKDRTEYLPPARIRDLKMTVITIASF